MQVKSAATEMSAKFQSVLSDTKMTIPPKTTKIRTAFVDHPSELKTTVTVTSLENLTGTARRERSERTQRNYHIQ